MGGGWVYPEEANNVTVSGLGIVKARKSVVSNSGRLCWLTPARTDRWSESLPQWPAYVNTLFSIARPVISKCDSTSSRRKGTRMPQSWVKVSSRVDCFVLIWISGLTWRDPMSHGFIYQSISCPQNLYSSSGQKLHGSEPISFFHMGPGNQDMLQVHLEQLI